VRRLVPVCAIVVGLILPPAADAQRPRVHARKHPHGHVKRHRREIVVAGVPWRGVVPRSGAVTGGTVVSNRGG